MRKLLPQVTSTLATQSTVLLDRDQSLLFFNERVLDLARRAEVPLLERLRYLCIVSSDLDELFEVRANLHFPVGHFKFLHLWSAKFPQAGRTDYQLTETFCARRAAASFNR